MTGRCADNRCTNRKTAADYPYGSFGMAMNNANPDTHSNNIEIRDNVIDGAKFGGLFLMGSGNRVIGNRFVNVNLAGCNEKRQKIRLHLQSGRAGDARKRDLCEPRRGSSGGDARKRD